MSSNEGYLVAGSSLDGGGRIRREHLERMAYIYVRQSSPRQVEQHRESAHRQYQRVEWAVTAGWPRERVVVVDDDQGTTATLPHARPGFSRLAQAVVSGVVGVVISLEGARLARNGPDWAELLFVCRWTDTLIADEHGVYDMTQPPDRMVLGIRGQINELELDTSIRRMQAARWSKAERGEYRLIPPAGYELDDLDQTVMAADQSVVEAIRSVFAKFDELGSARQVWQWWREQGLKYPVRRTDLRSRPVVWKVPTYRMVLATLHNPIYAGAYVYGRTQTLRALDPENPPKLRTRRVVREQPAVLLRDHHPAYITWDRFLEIQNQIRGNRAMRPDELGQPGPVRKGGALLQGLALCDHCGRRMYVSYGGNAGGQKGRTPQYRCCVARNTVGGTDCQVVGTKQIDELVVATFLEATRPATVEVVVQAEELAGLQSKELARIWQLEIEKAEYEARRAERQYQAVEPENRLVARSLERQWNERLEALEEVRARAAAACKGRPPLSDEERARLARLTQDLEAVWHAPSTTNRDRKALLRCLIEEVQLRTVERHYRVRIVWKGGATTDGEVRRHRGAALKATAEDTVELVRKLAVEFDDAQIARILNKQGRRTGRGNPFTQARVTSLRGHYRIPKCPNRPARDPQEGPFSADEAADELGVCSSTIHRWLRDGLLAGEQATPGAPWRILLTEDVRRRLSGGEAPPGWVGLTEAARRLGLSKPHVAYLVNSRKLEAVRVPVGPRTCWRINVDSATCGVQPELLDPMRSDTPEEA